MNRDLHLELREELDEALDIRIAVRRVRKNDGARLELLEHPLECGVRLTPIRKRCIPLPNLSDLARRVQFHALPVRREPFEEVVALYVAVVVGARDVGRIEIDEIVRGRLKREDIATRRPVRLSVVEDEIIEDLDRLDVVILQRQPKVAPAVVVATWAGDGEDAARLLLEARSVESR